MKIFPLNTARSKISPRSQRSGFTLIEMLISVALLLIIVTIFGQIFSIATNAIVTQRGIGVNDQKARTLDVTMRADLDNISYKPLAGDDGIIPMIGKFTPGPSNATPFDQNINEVEYNGDIIDEAMQGYFYISENNPDDDTDDVLAFTTLASSDEEPYYVNAINLASWTSTLTGNDHPDFDDGVLDNGTATSRKAEVCYFLRNGILYRRVLAIREPLFDNPPYETSGIRDGQPTKITATAEDLFLNNYPAARNFYSDFDFSARHDAATNHVKFNSTLEQLSDPRNRFGHLHAADYFATTNYRRDGLPREFVGTGTAALFMGRYTQEETSSINFKYPQQNPAAASHPIVRTYAAVDLTNFETSGRLNTVYNGTRIGEDILMTNVLAFDVEVWDDAIGQYVDLGHGIDADNNGVVDSGVDVNNDGRWDGDYAFWQYDINQPYVDSSNAAVADADTDLVFGNKLYGDPAAKVYGNNPLRGTAADNPGATAADDVAWHYTFDTWHYDVNVGSNTGIGLPYAQPANDNATYQPPIRTLRYPVYHQGLNGGNGIPKGVEDNAPWLTNTPTPDQQNLRKAYAVRWQAGLEIRNGDIVVPPYQDRFFIPNGQGEYVAVVSGNPISTVGGLPANANGNFYFYSFVPQTHRDIVAYRATVLASGATAGYATTTVGGEPAWKQIGGYQQEYINGTGQAVAHEGIEALSKNSQTKDGILWEKIYNVQPLKSIRITLQFRDVGSDQVRQLSIVHAMN